MPGRDDPRGGGGQRGVPPRASDAGDGTPHRGAAARDNLPHSGNQNTRGLTATVRKPLDTTALYYKIRGSCHNYDGLVFVKRIF